MSILKENNKFGMLTPTLKLTKRLQQSRQYSFGKRPDKHIDEKE